MPTVVSTEVRIALGDRWFDEPHDDPQCVALGVPLFEQLSAGGYKICSVQAVPPSLEEWRAGHRTARKRADRCERAGYSFRQYRREDHGEDIFDINTSKRERQGRPMSAGYQERPSGTPLPDYACPLHCIIDYGVFLEDRLVAYLVLIRSGQLRLVSQILGHGDHEKAEVMYLLFQGVVRQEVAFGGQFVYNRHDSGTEGLRFFKERLGFEPVKVDWSW